MRLFWRVFAWYLGTIVIVIGVGLGLLVLADPEFLFSRSVSVSRDALRSRADMAARAWLHGGKDELRAFLDRAPYKRYLFGAAGQELSGRPVSTALQDLARRAQGSSGIELEFLSPETYAALGFTVGGQRFAYESILPRERRFRFSFQFMPISLRIALGLATACVICLLFARYVTSPLRQLRAATREFANGNLRVRLSQGKLFKRGDEFTDLARDFDDMATRIQNFVDAQHRILGDISHELRSPLARLQLALEIARRKAGPNAAEALDRIEQEAERVNVLIGDVLLLAQTEHPHPRTKKLFDLANVIREVAQDADFEASAHDRHVVIRSNESSLVHGNRDLLRSAIENVVRNAIRYTGSGTSVFIDLRRFDTNRAKVTVRDSGPGVPDDALPLLFQPFYRVADARDRNSGGAGLGLAIAQHAVISHGGRVRAQNCSGGGLEVEIELPLTLPDPASRTGIKFRS